ncbi:MAG: 2,3-bisphosphoglycerate-independent phosphoglycerate mutase [Gammaproteobacteria bacterium]|nr:2,3-bisphosphoglycerate-independent phosphoglycerate mutase [Gammaproteobacteria bacterium]
MSINVPGKPCLLIIMDGFGCNPNPENNAVVEANTPHLDKYFSDYPFTTLQASGLPVGLPEGQMGNSEVGHMTIGCGNVLLQDLVRINESIKNGMFSRNPVFLDAIAASKRLNRPVHLIGLVSDGGVHSHIQHLIALITICREHNVSPAVHIISDGRDTAPQSALQFIEELEPHLEKANGHIASISGRYYAMDRDKRWDRIKLAWRCITAGKGEQANSAKEAIEKAYDKNITDEFILPSYIKNGALIQSYDQVIFFNFRNDRARQLTYTLAGKKFLPFDRGNFKPISLSCLTEYDPLLPLPVAFPPEYAETSLAEILSKNNIRQLHCAETEKYAHVTFFFNGGREIPFPGEERQMIPSPTVATYDLAPEMSAKYVTNEVIEAIKSERYGFIVVNYANGDMVGHTAIREAILQAVEVLDSEVHRLVSFALKNEFCVLLTADHGNCDEMVDPITGLPQTQHTTNPVPCAIIGNGDLKLKPDGGLSNIAPTILKIMGIEQPEKMRAKPLI